MGQFYEVGLGLCDMFRVYQLVLVLRVYELVLLLRVCELGLGVMGQFQDLVFVSGVQGLWVSFISQGQGYEICLGFFSYFYDLGFMSYGQGYELGLGLWLSNHNDYFYVTHQTRIINKIIKKN